VPAPRPVDAWPTDTPTPSPAAVAVDAAVADVPDTDDGFRDAVRTYAARPGTRRVVAAWGTLHLDGTAKRSRFATLDVALDKHDGSWRLLPGAAASGVYVVESAPGTFGLVGFQYDATSFHGAEHYDAATGAPLPHDPPWLQLEDNGILHGQNHNHGMNHATIAVRGGRWVVLHEDDDNSRRAADDDPDIDYVDADGTCKRCPPVAGHHFIGTDLVALGGSARSIAELPDRVDGDWTAP